MYIRYGEAGSAPQSEIQLDAIEDAIIGSNGSNAAFTVLYEQTGLLRNACEAAAADELLNPTCHDPSTSELTLKERWARIHRIRCLLSTSLELDHVEETVTLKAGCAADCTLRGKAIADPGILIIDETYPILVNTYAVRR